MSAPDVTLDGLRCQVLDLQERIARFVCSTAVGDCGPTMITLIVARADFDALKAGIKRSTPLDAPWEGAPPPPEEDAFAATLRAEWLAVKWTPEALAHVPPWSCITHSERRAWRAIAERVPTPDRLKARGACMCGWARDEHPRPSCEGFVPIGGRSCPRCKVRTYRTDGMAACVDCDGTAMRKAATS